ncbi:translation initiation factor IF-2-like [Physeter macrocephalus]|uniref:Translation initiation factor IF-2-like n=1 Tax=Physeter macrocephalus TaxID=9755 RepID=A0A455C7A3_PHYMC|nr:translation initiation factor IF-2-like [Physeter catodon]|eukprot:XP_028357289.1 uncharacterized protein LOC114488025 [Physeter catodon]
MVSPGGRPPPGAAGLARRRGPPAGSSAAGRRRGSGGARRGAGTGRAGCASRPTRRSASSPSLLGTVQLSISSRFPQGLTLAPALLPAPLLGRAPGVCVQRARPCVRAVRGARAAPANGLGLRGPLPTPSPARHPRAGPAALPAALPSPAPGGRARPGLLVERSRDFAEAPETAGPRTGAPKEPRAFLPPHVDFRAPFPKDGARP